MLHSVSQIANINYCIIYVDIMTMNLLKQYNYYSNVSNEYVYTKTQKYTIKM